MNDKNEIQKTKYNYKYKNIINDLDCNDIEANKEYLQNNIKSIEKVNSPKILCRKIGLNNEIKKNIKLLNEEISAMKNNDKNNLNIVNLKSNKIKELNIIINQLKVEISELKNYNDEKNNKIILLENDLIIAKKDIIVKNDKINNLNDKYFQLVSERNKNKQIINELNKSINKFEKEKQNEIINLRKVVEELKIINNKINNENIILKKKSEEQNKETKKLESLINILNEQIKNNNNIKDNNNSNNFIENNINNSIENNNDLNSLDSIKILENKVKIKRPSTPSFKVTEPDIENLEENKTNKDILEINCILLKKIKEYEAQLNMNQSVSINNKIIDENEHNANNNDINYYQNKYIYYYGLNIDNKKKIELLLKENEDLNEQLKNSNINNNNLITTFSGIKLNYQYNPNEYFILCDKAYKQFKWYLMKKQSEYNENDTYDNLIWVSSIDVVDIDNYNEYSKDDDSDNNEMLNIIKKLEEKENIISKLSYKVEKLEKELKQKKINRKNIHNSIYNDELFLECKKNFNINKGPNKWKKKYHNKAIKYFKNSVNDESLFNDNKCLIKFKKGISSRENVEEKLKEKENEGVPLEKYNLILEKLNKTEIEFSKLQKENMELRKKKQFYLSQNNNIVNIIPNNDIDKEKSDNDNNCIINFSSDINKLSLMGNNFINNINDDGLGLIKNSQIEENNYKKNFSNLEKK